MGASDKLFHRRRRERVVWLGPRAQAVLERVLASHGGGRVFSYPRGRTARDSGPVAVGRGTLARVVAEVCEAHGIPAWVPHQLRHTRATEVRDRYECDRLTGIAIGDTPEVASLIYADPAEAAAKRIAAELG